MERKARAAAAAAAAAAERVHVVRGAGEDSDGEPKEEEGGFYGPPYRRWLRDFLIPTDEKGDLVVVPPEDCLASTRPRRLGAGAGEPCMVDVVRAFWPGRKGMYTCEPLVLLSWYIIMRYTSMTDLPISFERAFQAGTQSCPRDKRTMARGSTTSSSRPACCPGSSSRTFSQRCVGATTAPCTSTSWTRSRSNLLKTTLSWR